MKKKYMIKLIAVVSICYIAMSMIIMNLSDLQQYRENYIDDYITGKLINSDGTETIFDSNMFGKTEKGDVLIAQIGLPMEYYIADSSICFRVYNSVVRLYYEDELLYEYGQEIDERGRLIGAAFLRVPIPEEAWGKELRLVCEIKEDYALSSLTDVMVIRTIDSIKYFLVNHEPEYIVYVAILLIASMFNLILAFYGKWTAPVRKGIYLCNYCTNLSLWMVASNGMYLVILNKVWFFAVTEYIAIFASPLPILMYLYEEQEVPSVRKRYGILTLIYAVFFAIMTTLNFTSSTIHYTKGIPILHCFFAITIGLVFKEFFYMRKNKNINKRILRYGMGFSMVVFSVEMIQYNIYKYTTFDVYNTNSISALSIMIMLVTITCSYSIQLAESLIGEKEKQHLKNMAVLDGLTGLANRTGCYEYFESMEIRQCRLYTLIYMDLNDLKPINDNYGHDEGDRLIQFLGKSLREIIHYDGFCGRLGGDEFVAVVEESQCIHVPEYLNRIMQEFSKANMRNEFPLPISVAYGMAKSTEENPIPVMEALRVADQNMYETKKRYKEKI